MKISIPPKLAKSAEKFKLSPRETQVIFLLAIGETWKSAADKLKISPRTVQAYVLRIRLKTHTPNTAATIFFLLA